MLRILLPIALFWPGFLAAADRYRAEFSPGLEHVTVEACFSGAPPERLYRHSQAGRFTDWIRIDGHRLSAGRGRSRLSLPSLPEGGCVSWQIDLLRATTHSDYRLAIDIGGSLLTNASLWFWRDDDRRSIDIELVLPSGHSVSTPWPEVDAAQSQRFRPVATPASWTSRIAIGPFALRRISVGGRNCVWRSSASPVKNSSSV